MPINKTSLTITHHCALFHSTVQRQGQSEDTLYGGRNSIDILVDENFIQKHCVNIVMSIQGGEYTYGCHCRRQGSLIHVTVTKI